MTVRDFNQQRETTSTVRGKGDLDLSQRSTETLFSWTEGAPRTSYSAGKTISLGDYQFARVSVVIEVEHSIEQEGDAFKTVKYLANEICEQEEASILKQDRSVRDFNHGGFQKFRITLDYGLTLKTGRFDSSKLDVALTRYALLPDLGTTLKGMRDTLSRRVQDEARSIKGASEG